MDRIVNGATLVVLLLVGVTAFKVLNSSNGAPRTPAPVDVGTKIPQLELVRGPDSTATNVSLSGSPHLLYVFLTTCPVCNGQHEAVAEWFKSLPQTRVISASSEPVARTAHYWDGTAAQTLPRPASLTLSAGKALKAGFVPYLIAIDGQGVVRYAHVGPMADADTAAIRRIVSAQ